MDTAESTPQNTLQSLLKGQVKKRKSHIYLPANGEEYRDTTTNELRWKCNRCKQTTTTYALSSSRAALQHLEDDHFISKSTGELIPEEKRKKNLELGQQTLRFGTLDSTTHPVKFHWRILRAQLARFIVNSNQSFSLVEQEDFFSLFHYVAITRPTLPQLCEAFPRSHNTVKRLISSLFEQNKQRVIESIQSAVSSIHLSFDLWTSASRHAVLGIAGYWVTSAGERKGVLLGLKRLEGRHSGENQAGIVWDLATELGFEEEIGYCTLDNASNNDTAMNELERFQNDLDISFIATERRLRCLGHTINLSVQAFLWGENVNSFAREQEEDTSGREQVSLADELAAMREWRKKGPMGKLHNVLIYILRSPQQIRRFENKVKEFQPTESILRLTIGCPTRWSSDYDSLDRAIRFQPSIDAFIMTEILTASQPEHTPATANRQRRGQRGSRRGSRGRGGGQARGRAGNQRRSAEEGLQEDTLLPTDWEVLKAIHHILRPMRNFTKRLQGKGASRALISEVIPAMDDMLIRYEKVCLLFPSLLHF